MGNYGEDTNEATCTSHGEGFSPDEGLEMIRLFQSIPRRADRQAALDIIKRIAAQSRRPDGDTVALRKPRAV